jgi:hypothetical protein
MMSKAGRAARPYALWIVPFVLLSVLTRSPWPLVFAIGGVTHLAGARMWEHHWAHRPGSRGALRRTRRSTGPATMTELREHMSLHAARRSVRRLRPLLGRAWRLPAHEAGVHLGTARRSAR